MKNLADFDDTAPAADLRGLNRTTIVVKDDALGELVRIKIDLSPVGRRLVMQVVAALAAVPVTSGTPQGAA